MPHLTLTDLIHAEETRQRETLALVASENYVSRDVLAALGTCLTNKYSEGYPGARYYAGNEVVDQIEQRAIDLAKQLFRADHANVQPYSGSPANVEAYAALVEPGSTILSMSLSEGGHLTHGHKASLVSKMYRFVHYGVDPDTGRIDYDVVAALAEKERPALILAGATAYPRIIDFDRFKQIADHVEAKTMADISHIAGLIAGGVHPNPVPTYDVVTTTTHKTLRGPRGAMILARSDFAQAVDKAVFPGFQGGPHNNVTAAKVACFEEALRPSFATYAAQIVANARALSAALLERGWSIVTDGTDNHLLLVDLRSRGVTGASAEQTLAHAGIVVNKNLIPGDQRPARDPSGLRLGTAAITSRGMGARDMVTIAQFMTSAIENANTPDALVSLRAEVVDFLKSFSVPGLD